MQPGSCRAKAPGLRPRIFALPQTTDARWLPIHHHALSSTHRWRDPARQRRRIAAILFSSSLYFLLSRAVVTVTEGLPVIRECLQSVLTSLLAATNRRNRRQFYEKTVSPPFGHRDKAGEVDLLLQYCRIATGSGDNENNRRGDRLPFRRPACGHITTVEPTKLNPRCLRSLLNSSD